MKPFDSREVLYYLASPYTHPDKQIMADRAKQVTEALVKMMKQGLTIFCPVAYNAQMAVEYNLPGDWKFWEKHDKIFLDHCEVLLVYTMEGWEQSVGVQEEITYAKDKGKSVVYLSKENIFGKSLAVESAS